MSSNLGDTIAWMPVVEEYRKLTNEQISVSTAHNDLFNYPEIEFFDLRELYVEYLAAHPSSAPPPLSELVDIIVGMYCLEDFQKPLQQVAADALGIEFSETRPCLNFEPDLSPLDADYICIAPHATSKRKYWNADGGWQTVIDHFTNMGYKVVHASLEPPFHDNVIDASGKSLKNIMNVIHHSKLFIGMSTGSTWLAWALHKPVVMISGHSPSWLEFECERIINTNVCHDCYSRKGFIAEETNDCPFHKNYECTTQITPAEVIEATKAIIK